MQRRKTFCVVIPRKYIDVSFDAEYCEIFPVTRFNVTYTRELKTHN